MSTPDIVVRSRLTNLRDDLGVLVVLVVVWLLFWGDLSVANVVSGILVAGVIVVVFPLDHAVVAVRHHLRPVAAARLGAFIAWDIVRSTFTTALEVVRPRYQIRTGIVACPLRVENDGLVTFMANVIAISPGIMPIEVGYNPHVLYLHALHAEDPEVVRRFVVRLEDLSVRALGGPEAIAALSRPAAWPLSAAEDSTVQDDREDEP